MSGSRRASSSACAFPAAGKYRAVLIDDKVISSQQGVKYVFVVKAGQHDRASQRRNRPALRRETDREEGTERRRESRLDAPADRAAGHAGGTVPEKEARRPPPRTPEPTAGQRRARRKRKPRSKRRVMNFAHFFIDRPIFAGVISILITLVGGIAMLTLPIAQYPDIAPPTIQVTTSYPGANAKTVAETVATPIEQQINGVENMLYMSSSSTSDGVMTLNVTFKLGTNIDQAQVLVQNRVATADSRRCRRTCSASA